MTRLDTDKVGTSAGVLIVSSDATLREHLAPGIEPLGVYVDHITDPATSHEHLRKKTYKLVLVDADSIEDKAGEFFFRMRQRHPELVILVTAADPSKPFLLELIHAGVNDFVSKPVDSVKFCSTVRLVCKRPAVARPTAPAGERTATDVATDQKQAELSREVYRANQELHVLNKTLKQHVSQLTILYQMGRDISENENWSDALDRFLMALVNYIRAEGSALLLFSERETRLSVRSNFQIDPAILSQSCQVLVENWKHNPRGGEIHTIESYKEMVFNACLDRRSSWRFTVIPLRHRNRSLGFLFIDKLYRSGHGFKVDYHFLNTIQTILAEEVANASYISELRQLSRFNHKVLDNIKSGVITTDLKGNVRFYNQQAAAMCPHLTGQAATHFERLFNSSTFGKDFHQRILNSQKDTHVLDVTYRGRNEGEFPARLNITKMHDDNLNGTVLVAIFEDLTEQKQLEREIRRNDRLRVLGQLSAGVAHEIRNPLTGIATSVEVLGSKIQDEPEKAKYIRVILEEINRLNEIIRNLLNFARPTKPQINSFGLAELSQRVVNLLSDEARKKGIQLDIQDQLKHARCNADANQLTQVVLNIVLNSIQACKMGDSVSITLKNEDSPDAGTGAFARIDVEDTGVGVPPEVRDSLFEPFVTTKTHGTGLGLAISQQIIEEHHGQISCEFLKQGTRFSIKLPIGEAQLGGHTT